jgi:transcription-repair coupling factor (superfamily II helicase)
MPEKSRRRIAYSPDSYLQRELEASFIYEDTHLISWPAQEAVKEDMETATPMDRLVCGDVGFGKTEVAVRAAFKAATDIKQNRVLVPTTILALQRTGHLLPGWRTFLAVLTISSRHRKPSEQKKILKQLADGEIDIIVGTHKLTGKDVKFKDLGLLVIDEEQRFGVAVKETKKIRAGVDTLPSQPRQSRVRFSFSHGCP